MGLTNDTLVMFDDWPELSSLLARALPTANVNFLYPEAEDAGGEYSVGEKGGKFKFHLFWHFKESGKWLKRWR